MDHNKLWKILKEMGIPEHLIYLLRNLCAGQEASDRTRNGTRVVQNWERNMSSFPKAVYCHLAYLTYM